MENDTINTTIHSLNYSTETTPLIDKKWWDGLLQYGKICSGYTWQHIFALHVAFHDKRFTIKDLMHDCEEFGCRNCFDCYLQRFKQGFPNFIETPDNNFFAKITNLDYLLLFKTGIETLVPLLPLKNLTKVYCYQNDITDLTPLKELNNLKDLRCYYTRIQILAPLNDLHSLEK